MSVTGKQSKRRLDEMTAKLLAQYPDALKYGRGTLGIGLCNDGNRSLRGPKCRKCGVALCQDCVDGLRDECLACYDGTSPEDVRNILRMAAKRFSR